MNKVLIKNAILSENVFKIDNRDEDYPVKGRFKIINFEQFKIEQSDFKDISKSKLAENKIGRLDIEYTNLTFSEASFITNIFQISDLDGYKFNEIDDQDVIQAISNHLNESIWYVLDDRNKTFIPKIKMKISIFYLLPDEETEYYVEIRDCEIEEI